MKYALLVLLTLFSLRALALGNEGPHGGDLCEDRFKVVRDDLQSWIRAGGSSGLTLPKDVPLAQYNTVMLQQIASAHVSCTDQILRVEDAEKICINTPGQPSEIVCDRSAFLGATPDGQYTLVHHEYASLAGLEKADGADSKYELSNQIAAYIEHSVVSRLVVKNPNAEPTSTAECASRFMILRKGQTGGEYVVGPSLSMSGKSHGGIGVPGRSDLGYAVTARSDGSIHIFMKMVHRTDQYEFTSESDGFATGQSYATVIFENQMLLAKNQKCEIEWFKVVCAATQEAAQSIVRHYGYADSTPDNFTSMPSECGF